MGFKILSELIDKENHIEQVLENLKVQGKKVVIYGAGYCGHETLGLLHSHGIPVKAAYDDCTSGGDIDGLPIESLSNLHPNEHVAILLTSGFNRTMKSRLSELGLISYYVPADFGRYDADKENYAFFEEHAAELQSAYDLLTDRRSREIFLRLVNYRISREPEALADLEENGQYFPHEQELNLSSFNKCFLDLGAYDGDSLCGFRDYVHDKYDLIVAVEASRKNYEKLLRQTQEMHRVECHCVGVWSERGELRFTVSDAKNSFAAADGDSVLAVDTVDNIMSGRAVSFIKMDVEGAEYEAIQGARNTIRRFLPAMAISVYHKVEDLFRLQLLVESIAPEKYTYYLRHYSPTVIETVLYAVPRENRKEVPQEG